MKGKQRKSLCKLHNKNKNHYVYGKELWFAEPSNLSTAQMQFYV